MRIILVTVLLFATFSSSFFAQDVNKILDVIDALDKTQIFIENRKFKKDFVSYTKTVGSQILTYEDYEELKVSYEGVQDVYNQYLSEIKNDLSNYSEVKKMIKKPEKYARNYLNNFSEVVDEYEGDFLPLAESIEKKYDQNGGVVKGIFSSITPKLIFGAIDLFKKVVDIIKGKKEDKSEIYDLMLSMVNKHFYNKYKMDGWAELNIRIPDGSTSGISLVMEPIDVDPPLFNTLKGWFEFNYLDSDGSLQKMSFNVKTKDLTVETQTNQKGKVVNSEILSSMNVFNSAYKYADGTQFQMKTYNSGGIYILTKNSSGTVSVLYPYERSAAEICKGELTHDLTNQPKSILIGKDRNNVTTLPPMDCSSGTAVDQFITIGGSFKEKENLIVLLTKSELDVDDFTKKLAYSNSSLEESIVELLGDKLINPQDATAYFEGGKYYYDSEGKDKTVLPVVFYVHRKN